MKNKTPNINEILRRPEYKGCSARGADMGRQNETSGWNLSLAKYRLHLQRLNFVDGDYDVGGAYWGGGVHDGQGRYQFMWCAFSMETTPATMIFVRAANRSEAIHAVYDMLDADGDLPDCLPPGEFFHRAVGDMKS